jgi:hypothetical protein
MTGPIEQEERRTLDELQQALRERREEQ